MKFLTLQEILPLADMQLLAANTMYGMQGADEAISFHNVLANLESYYYKRFLATRPSLY